MLLLGTTITPAEQGSSSSSRRLYGHVTAGVSGNERMDEQDKKNIYIYSQNFTSRITTQYNTHNNHILIVMAYDTMTQIIHLLSTKQNKPIINSTHIQGEFTPLAPVFLGKILDLQDKALSEDEQMNKEMT